MTLRQREFVTLLRGAAAAWPLAARAQQPAGGVPRLAIGIAGFETDREVHLRLAAFRAALAKLGWVEGRNIRIDYAWPKRIEALLINVGRFFYERRVQCATLAARHAALMYYSRDFAWLAV